MQEVEWFAGRVPAIALAQKASDRKKMIRTLRKSESLIAAAYDEAAATAEAASNVAGGRAPFAAKPKPGEARIARDYPLLSGGDANLYALFVERAARIVRPDGIVGLLVPSGIAADKGAAAFFRSVSTTGRLGALLDFENGAHKPAPFFPDVHRSFKFCTLVIGGRERTFAEAECAFFQGDVDTAETAAFPLKPQDFAALNPNTGTAPVFRTPRDAEITRGIYRRTPILVDRRGAAPRALWPVRYSTMFHMTNDSARFRTEAELIKAGAYRVTGQRWERGDARWLPLTVGRSINLFDHRAAAVTENPANVNRPFNSKLTTPEEYADPAFVPAPQFWVAEADVPWPADLDWAMAFRDITASTNARTVIAALVPRAAFGNPAPLLLPDLLSNSDKNVSDNRKKSNFYKGFAPLLTANLCAMSFDYIARQKVQSTHVNFYIMEQLPFIPPDRFAHRFGQKTAEQIIRDDVLHLTYVSHDMTAFARDQGCDGPPFAWDEEDRLRRRARLDAVFFHLYGLDRDDAAYILGTFPIVRRDEEARYGGQFRSRDLILGTMAALAAGCPDAAVAG